MKHYNPVIPGPFVESSVRGIGDPSIPGPNLQGQSGFPADYWYGPNNPSDGDGCVPYASPEAAAMHWADGGARVSGPMAAGNEMLAYMGLPTTPMRARVGQAIDAQIAEAEESFDMQRSQITNLSASPVSNMEALGEQAMFFAGLQGLPVTEAEAIGNLPRPIAPPLGTPASQDQALYLLEQAAPPPNGYGTPAYLQQGAVHSRGNLPGPNLQGQSGFGADYWYGPNNPGDGDGCVPYASPYDAAMRWNGQGQRPVLTPPTPPMPPPPVPPEPPIYVTELPQLPSGEIPVKQVPTPVVQEILDQVNLVSPVDQLPPIQSELPIRPIEMEPYPIITADQGGALDLVSTSVPMLTQQGMLALLQPEVPMLTQQGMQALTQQDVQMQAPILTQQGMQAMTMPEVEPAPMLSGSKFQAFVQPERALIRGAFNMTRHPRG